MSELEQLNQNLAELTRTVQEKHAAGEAFDKAAFAAEMEKLVEAKVAAQVAEKQREPQRRIPGEDVAMDQASEAIGKANRYHKVLKDISRDGYSAQHGRHVKAVDLALAQAMMNSQMKHWSPAFGGQAHEPSQDLAAAVKALTSTGVATGAEYVPTDLAAQLWDDFFLASRIAGAMQIIPMPTNPFDVPLGLGSVTWRKGSQNTAVSASDPGTAKSTLTATELVTEQNWSYTLDEDAIVAMSPAMRGRLAQSGAEIIDAFVLNADATNAATGNINSDDALPAADSYFLSEGQDGLRHQWLVDNTAQSVDAGGALTDAKITEMLGKMGKYAINPNELLLIADVQTYLNGFLKTGTGAPGEYFSTLDKVGPNAVILTGQMGQYRGIPVIVSASAPLTAADGKADADTGNNTKGQVTAVNRMMWYAGFRRELLIEMDRDIQRRVFIMVSSIRQAVAAHGTRATAKHVAGLRNITV